MAKIGAGDTGGQNASTGDGGGGGTGGGTEPAPQPEDILGDVDAAVVAAEQELADATVPRQEGTPTEAVERAQAAAQAGEQRLSDTTVPRQEGTPAEAVEQTQAAVEQGEAQVGEPPAPAPEPEPEPTQDRGTPRQEAVDATPAKAGGISAPEQRPTRGQNAPGGEIPDTDLDADVTKAGTQRAGAPARPQEAPEVAGETPAPSERGSARRGPQESTGGGAPELVLGPPGQLEQTVLGPITGPKGDVEETITTAAEENVASQAILGPPGAVEQGLGEGVATGTQAVSDVGGALIDVGETAVGLAGIDRPSFGPLSGQAESFTTGAARTPGNILAAAEPVRQIGSMVFEFGQERTVQAASGDVPEAAAETGAAGAAAGSVIVEGLVEQATENPARFAGKLTGEVAAGLGVGRLAGSAARGARPRIRTLGSTEIDLSDVVNRRVIEGEERFPGAADPETFRTDPARAVREQAEDFTPEEVDQAFRQRGVTAGTVQKKTLEVEPEGPGRGRTAQGFEAPEAESELAEQFESPGAFTSPELSPNFLRLDAREADMRLRPGLPSLGGQPTAVFAKVDVENPRAQTLEEFNQELVEERAGEATAVTKPAGVGNVGEIESVLPPGATLADVGGGPVRDTLRRFGVGSDFRVEVEGQRVPVRLGAPESRVSGRRGLRDLFSDESAQLGRAGSGSVTRRLDISEIRRRAQGEPVDRPAPIAPGGSSVPDGATPSNESATPRGFDGSGAEPSRRRPRDELSAGDGVTPTPSGGGNADSTREAVPGSSSIGPFGGSDSGGGSQPGSTPSAPPDSPFIPGTPSSPPVSGPPESPPPSTPPSTPPPSPPPSSPPSVPPSAPPSTPPTVPPDVPPGTPPSTPPPSPPTTPPPTGPPPTNPPPIFGSDADDRDDEVLDILPTGEEFVNPVASSSELLTGENTEVERLFGF